MLLSGCPLLLTISADTLLAKIREVERIFVDALATHLSRKYFKLAFLTQLLTWHPVRLRLKIERLKEVLPPDILTAALAKDPTLLSLDTRQVAKVLRVLREVAADRGLLKPGVLDVDGQLPAGVDRYGAIPTFSFADVDKRLATLAEEPPPWQRSEGKGHPKKMQSSSSTELGSVLDDTSVSQDADATQEPGAIAQHQIV